MKRRQVVAMLASAVLAPGCAAIEGLTAAKAADPIRLGVSLSLSGRFSDSAKYMKEGYELWQEEAIKRGGIDGRPVEIVIYDDESNPDTGRVLAERLIDRDKATLILGPYSSPITDAAATAAERAQVPMIGTLASDSSMWERRKLRWTFQAFPSSTFDHESFLAILKQHGATLKKLAIVYEEAPFSITAKNWALEKAKADGLTVEAFGYNPGNQDFRSIIERIVAFGAEAVSMGGYYQPAIALSRQMMERGYNPPAYHFIQASDGVTKDALGANATGIFGRSAWEPASGPEGSKEFAERYRAKFGREPSYHSAAAFAACQLAEAAIRAKGLDKAALRDFLATAEVKTIFGTYKVNARGQQEGYHYVVTQWQDGHLKVIDAATKPIWPKPAWQK